MQHRPLSYLLFALCVVTAACKDAAGPTPSPSASPVISAGDSHTCGLTTAAAAYCWGWNEEGQLGDGTTINRAAPTPVSGWATLR